MKITKNFGTQDYPIDKNSPITDYLESSIQLRNNESKLRRVKIVAGLLTILSCITLGLLVPLALSYYCKKNELESEISPLRDRVEKLKNDPISEANKKEVLDAIILDLTRYTSIRINGKIFQISTNLLNKANGHVEIEEQIQAEGFNQATCIFNELQEKLSPSDAYLVLTNLHQAICFIHPSLKELADQKINLHNDVPKEATGDQNPNLEINISIDNNKCTVTGTCFFRGFQVENSTVKTTHLFKLETKIDVVSKTARYTNQIFKTYTDNKPYPYE